MIQSGPGNRGMCSCMALMLSILLLCGIVGIFGQRAAAPGLIVWLAVALILVYLMVSSLRRGQMAPRTQPGGSVDGAGAEAVPTPSGVPANVLHPFRDWLLARMIARDLTSMQLALQLAVRDDLVEDWVQGRRLPSPIDCARLAALFDVPERDVMRLAEWSK